MNGQYAASVVGARMFSKQRAAKGYGPFLPEHIFLLLTGRIMCIITTFFYFNEASEDSVQTFSSINATSSKKR